VLDEAFGEVSKLKVLGHLLRYLQSPHSQDVTAAVLLGLATAARNCALYWQPCRELTPPQGRLQWSSAAIT
jgi:hypothetical protein